MKKNRLQLALLLQIMIMIIGGCAAPANRDIALLDQEAIRKIGITAKLVKSEMDVLGETGGALSGALLGFLTGMDPRTWIIGGPITLPVAAAVIAAECKSELGFHDNPKLVFENTIKRLELPSRLERSVISTLNSAVPRETMSIGKISCPHTDSDVCIRNAATDGKDAVLELDLYILLSGTIVKIEEKSRCGPWITTRVAARLRRVADGKALAENNFLVTPFQAHRNPMTFQQLLTNEQEILALADDHLARIAEMITEWIFGH